MLSAVKSVSGTEVLMKLRCSQGLTPESYYGVGQVSSTSTFNDEIELSGIDRETTSCFSIKQSAPYQDGQPMYYQLAILYTSLPSSQRIVRVHNLQLFSSTDPSVVFKHADVDCLVTFYSKLAITTMLTTPPPFPVTRPSAKEYHPPSSSSSSFTSSFAISSSSSSSSSLAWRNPKANISQYLLDSCLDILLKYRQICSSHSPKGQLILPEALKILPLYTLCLMKHPAFLHNHLATNVMNTTPLVGSTNRADRLGVDVCERAAELNRLLRCSARELLRSLYPRLYPLHRLQEGDGYPPEDDDLEENEVSLLLLLCVYWSVMLCRWSHGLYKCQLGSNLLRRALTLMEFIFSMTEKSCGFTSEGNCSSCSCSDVCVCVEIDV
jgi:hypothetical protein